MRMTAPAQPASKSTDSFTTSEGRKIPLVNGYRALFPHFYWDSPEVLEEQAKPDHQYRLFLNHLLKYAAVMDLLESQGLKTRWKSALDVGALDGTISRMLTTDGRAGRADAIDQTDLCASLTEDQFNAHLKRLNEELAETKNSHIARDAFLDSIPFHHEMAYTPPDGSTFWSERDLNASIITNYYEQNIYEFRSETSYDLITTFLTSVVLDTDVAFPKFAELLEPGGLFIMIEPYWWCPYLFFGVAGEFPWAFQRLSVGDLEKYIDAHHSDDRTFLIERLEVFRHRHTVDSYIRSANRNGLSLVGVRRFIQTEQRGMFRAKLSPQYMNQFPDARCADVIDDIRAFRPDVQIVDLMTNYVAMVFRKETAPTSATLSLELNSA